MTDKQKSEYFDQWESYFEPLARVRAEVKKALPHYKGRVTYDLMEQVIMFDAEVRTELENLIQTMLNEVDDDN